ncbi:MAG: protein-L-isoaspartate(D-aspartate) O-methyltransferase [Thermoleophilia bacterium]
MTDTTADHGARRARMVAEQIGARGVRDGDVLAAMQTVPRHLFVPVHLAAEAYHDTPLPIGYGQTISQPYMVARMTELLAVDVRSRVLEVGSGSGYQTAVLAELAGEVFALERLAALAEGARHVLARLAYANVRTAVADGTRGWPEYAPYDGILVAAATAETPRPLLAQLAEGGRLVIPLGRQRGEQVLTVLERHGDEYTQRLDTRCRFVPLVSDAGRAGGESRPAPPGKAGPRVDEEELGMKAVDVSVHGRVQGVYYRASARVAAERLGLRGWVKNTSDGCVALRLQGDPTAVHAMLDWCRVGPPAAEVGWLDVSDAEPDETLTTFEVR